MDKIFYVCGMMPLKNIVPGRDYEDIPAGVDTDRLEKIYRGLVERGLPEADIPVAMSYMINESGADPSREDRYGKGLLDGIYFKDNMFIDDDDEVLLGKQLDFIVDEIENGDIDTVKDLSDTDYGKAITDRIYGTVNPKDLNSVFNGGIGWKYSEGGALDTFGMLYTRQNDDGLRKYYKSSPYDLPAIEEDDEGNKRIVGMSDVTSSVVNGTDQLLYDDDFMKSHTMYQDGNGRYILLDNKVLPKINDENIGKEITSEELKKIMPDIGYIGGDGYRLRVASLIPGLLERVQDKADSYGINPNLVLHRLMKEGFIDKITEAYNDSSDEDKKHFFTDGHLWNNSYSGFGDLGLDDAGQHLLDGRYILKDNQARWFTLDDGVENEKGRSLTNVPVAEDLNSALEMVAAEMSYRQEMLRQRGIPQEYLTAYTNAAYNAGLNHPLLRNSDLVLGRYSVPDWYGQVKALAYGGNLYDGETMESGQMLRGPLWDPKGTVLIPMPQQSGYASSPENTVVYDTPAVELRQIQPNQYEVPLVTPELKEMVRLSQAQIPVLETPEIKPVSLPEGFALPQGVSVQRPDNARLTLLRKLGDTAPQIDNTVVTAPLNEGSPVYTPEMTYNEAIALGKTDGNALAQAMNNLPKTDEDIRALQGMLFDEGYYDTSNYVPKITARTDSEVRALQQMLLDNGYDLGRYGVDGKLGDENSYTRRAYAQYVKDHPTEAMRQAFVDGNFGKGSRAAYAKYLTDRVKTSLPKIENSPLSLQMYEAISAPTRLAGMATTVIPSHIGAFMNKQANNVYGKLVGIEDYDGYVGDTVENAYLNLEKAKKIRQC